MFDNSTPGSPVAPIAITRETFLALQVALLQQQLWQAQAPAYQQQVDQAMIAAGLNPRARYTLDPATSTATPISTVPPTVPAPTQKE